VAAPPRECRAVVAATRALAPDVLEADLRMDDPPALTFAAGQWISVPFGPKTVRAYSIASTPRSSRRITLCADVEPGGIGSRWFRALEVDQTVGFKAPFGGFVFPRDDLRRPLFVAEEIGIVPIRAILTDLDETTPGRPATLIYGGRDATRLPYDAGLRSLARRHPDLAYHRREGAPSGDLASAVDALIADVSGLVAYVAGGGAMIAAARAVLMAKGMDRKSVKWEKFW
jgi:ferredoxin-NADP reductase